MDDTRTYTDQRRGVGRCTHCGTKIHADYAVELTQWAYDGRLAERRVIIYPDGRRQSVDPHRGAFESLRIYCPRCDARVYVRPVVGRVTATPCGPRCTGAVGPVCECQCGGQNHGGRLAVAATR